MWVFCCGMYRSASTLQFQITTRLVQEAGVGQKVGWIDTNRFAEVKAVYGNQAGFKVIKAHRCTDAIAAEFLQNQAIGIYIFRDLRDVYASMLKQKQKPFEYLWNEGFIEECLDNYHRWTTLPNVLVSHYKTVLNNVSAEVERIAAHLGITLTPQMAQAIAAEYSPDIQRERVQRFREILLQMSRQPSDHREIVDYHDEETLLHMNHLDSAKVGRWVDDLSATEVQLIETKVEAWCSKAGYSPSIFLHAPALTNP